MEREPYWDFMGKRLREERERNEMKESDLYRREIYEAQRTLQHSLIRQKELRAIADSLSKKVAILGGDPNQLEMDF